MSLTSPPINPMLRLKIDGRTVADTKLACVLEATAIQDVEDIGSFELVAHLWDEEKQRRTWLAEELAEGAPVELHMHLRGEPTPVFHGEVTGLAVEFPDRAPATITVRGYDCRHRLLRGAVSHSFVQVRDSEIAEKFAAGAGLSIEAEKSPVRHRCLIQTEQTNYEFLRERAAAIGYELAVRADKLLFRKPPLAASPVATLDVTTQVVEFRAALSVMRQVDRVVTRGFDPAAKKFVQGDSQAGQAGIAMGGISGPDRAKRSIKAATHTTAAWPVTTAQEAELLARGLLVASALRHVRGEAVVVGDPALAAGRVVAFENAGPRFDGNYYITQATHRFNQRSGASYRTTLGLRRSSS